MKFQRISEPGLILQGTGVIHIDASMWTTQALLTKKLKLGRNVVNNRVRRSIENGTLKTFYIEDLGITLIPNVSNINDLGVVLKNTKKKLSK